MRIQVHVSNFYTWPPLPAETQAKMTPADVAHALEAKLLRPAANGRFTMRQPAGRASVANHQITEQAIINFIVYEKAHHTRMGRTFSRRQAIAHMISEDLGPGTYEAAWIDRFEVEADDGPEPELMSKTFAPLHVTDHGRKPGVKIIDPAHAAAHLAAYTQAKTSKDLEDHLHAHFGVTPKAVQP
jgi:hypothetical protein